MRKKLYLLFAIIITTTLITSACSNNEKKQSKEEPPEEKVVEENEPEEEVVDEGEDEKEEKEEEEKDTETEDSSAEFSSLISYMEEETEGTTSVLYENNEPQVHELEDLSVSLDAYTLVELKDFHTNFQIPFNDQTDGGVIIAKYTVANDSDEDAYFMPSLYLTYTGAQKDYNNYRELLPLEEQLPVKLAPSTDYLIEAGETITGYYTYPFGEDILEEVLDLGTVMVEVPTAQREKDSYDTTIGKEGKFNISLNEDGEEKVSSNQAFYEDKVTVEDMGEKEMLKEKDGIDESEELADVKFTMEGYQFTEFTPNSVEAPRFDNFTNGIVLLTVKFGLENNNSADLGLDSFSGKLTVNDGAQYMRSEAMLLPYSYGDMIESGDEGELLQIFILDQEQYEKIWKDKEFEIELGPLRDDEAKDISKGKVTTFTLPE